MRIDDYGPVPVSRMKAESGAIFNALEAGRRVLISKRGRVVAAITPPDASALPALADYALVGGLAFPELTASVINDSASPAIQAAMSGETLFVTRDDQIYGLLSAARHDATADALSDEDLSELDDLTERYVAQHPDSSAADLSELRKRFIAEREMMVPAMIGSLDWLTNPLLEHMSEVTISAGTRFAAEVFRRRLEEDLNVDLDVEAVLEVESG